MNKPKSEKRNFTSHDVAELAGVSQATVSRVFAGNTKVSEKKRKRIMEAAQKLNYRPNAHARSLITRRSMLIGIVMRTIRNPFYSAVLEIFHDRFSKLGYHLIFINSENENVEEWEIHKLLEYNVAGVIISDALLTPEAEERFKENGIAVVLFNRYTEGSENSVVFCDNYLSAKQIATYLVKTGHRSFAYISGPSHTSITKDRLRGFREVLDGRGISNLHVESGDYTYESGFELAQELMTKNKDIDCIFGGNDIIALGVMDAVRMLGFEIPNDVSVIGFDNIRMTNWASYNLTTWEQPLEGMVDNTVTILLDEINGKETRSKMLVMKGRLVIRNTVKSRK